MAFICFERCMHGEYQVVEQVALFGCERYVPCYLAFELAVCDVGWSFHREIRHRIYFGWARGVQVNS